MATVRSHYDTDRPDLTGPEGPLPLETIDGLAIDLPVMWKIHLSFYTRSLALVFFVPASGMDPVNLCKATLQNHAWVLNVKKGLSISDGFVGETETRSLDDCVFTGRVLLYVDMRLSPAQIQEIALVGEQHKLAVDVRDVTYAEKMDKRQTPDAFIAHDSRDKAAIARPLAVNLSQGPCKVWFDEFSLDVGDRLRDTIELGLKTCKKCILVLTPNFLSNTGWTKTEFDSIFTRELLTREDIVLPIWAGVSQRDVFDYSPGLANRLGVDWALGIDEVSKRLLKAIL